MKLVKVCTTSNDCIVITTGISLGAIVVTAKMSSVKTPCIGICSTTSLGDIVCRGCKRYSFEVIDWNGYDATAKQAVMKRIEKLTAQILESKFRIFSVPNLQLGLAHFKMPFHPDLSPYCWLHNLLSKHHLKIDKLEDYGVYIQPEFAHMDLHGICELVEQEMLVLCEAHYRRYIDVGCESKEEAV